MTVRISYILSWWRNHSRSVKISLISFELIKESTQKIEFFSYLVGTIHDSIICNAIKPRRLTKLEISKILPGTAFIWVSFQESCGEITTMKIARNSYSKYLHSGLLALLTIKKLRTLGHERKRGKTGLMKLRIFQPYCKWHEIFTYIL